MKTLGEVSFMLDDNYHIKVETIEERDNLIKNRLIKYENKLFELQIGLKVFVKSEDKKYELTSVEENNWKEII
jgi:hypothetical protein